MIINGFQRTDNLKADILSIALIMFREYGYEGTTFQKIADVLGITKGAITYHFKNKYFIMEYFILEYFDLIRDFIDSFKDEYRNSYWRISVMYIYIYRSLLQNERNQTMFFYNKQMELWEETKIDAIYNIYKTIGEDFHKSFTHEELMLNAYMDLGARRRLYKEFKNHNELFTIDKFCYYHVYLIGCLSKLDEKTIKDNIEAAFLFADEHTPPTTQLFAT